MSETVTAAKPEPEAIHYTVDGEQQKTMERRMPPLRPPIRDTAALGEQIFYAMVMTTTGSGAKHQTGQYLVVGSLEETP